MNVDVAGWMVEKTIQKEASHMWYDILREKTWVAAGQTETGRLVSSKFDKIMFEMRQGSGTYPVVAATWATAKLLVQIKKAGLQPRTLMNVRLVDWLKYTDATGGYAYDSTDSVKSPVQAIFDCGLINLREGDELTAVLTLPAVTSLDTTPKVSLMAVNTFDMPRQVKGIESYYSGGNFNIPSALEIYLCDAAGGDTYQMSQPGNQVAVYDYYGTALCNATSKFEAEKALCALWVSPNGEPKFTDVRTPANKNMLYTFQI